MSAGSGTSYSGGQEGQRLLLAQPQGTRTAKALGLVFACVRFWRGVGEVGRCGEEFSFLNSAEDLDVYFWRDLETHGLYTLTDTCTRELDCCPAQEKLLPWRQILRKEKTTCESKS